MFLAVVVTTPLVALALYMWTMWNPTDTLNRMPVALVDLDQPAQQGSTTFTAGADVTRNLLASHALDFHVVDHDEAMTGISSGRYYFAVEIPADFSRTLASIGTTSTAPALITVTYNDRTTLMASNIGARAMSAINSAVLEGIATRTVGTLLSGLDGLGAGIRTAAGGSTQLHDGLSQLATGADTLAEGVRTQLAPGVAEAVAGGDQLAAGAATLAAGLSGLQTGTDQLGAGAQRVAAGTDQLVNAVDATGLAKTLNDLAGQLPSGTLDQITALLNGLRQLRAGSHQIADQLTDPKATYRSGLDQLVTGGGQVSDGANRLATGLHQLDTGTGSLAAGALLLQQGLHTADASAGQLTDGLSSGAEQMGNLGDAQRRTSLAQLLSTPIGTTAHNIAPAPGGGPGAAPMLMVLITALVPVIVLMCMRAHRFIAADEPAPPLAVAARRTAVAGIASLAVVAVLGTVVWHALSPAPAIASTPHLVIAITAATIMNTTLASLLFTVLGYTAGVVGSLAALMLQIFSYGGVWMIETLPAPLRWLHPIAPMTYTQHALVQSFDTVPGFSISLLVIVLITVAAATANALAYRCGRTHWPRVIRTRTAEAIVCSESETVGL